MKRLALCVLCLMLVAPALAKDKTIDKRTKTDADGNKYYVVFCARDGVPGHAFVVWGMEDSKRQLSTSEAFGFYPDSAGVKALYSSVPGSLRRESFGTMSRITDRLIVRVNRDVYLKSQAPISKWSTSNYNLYSANCINFTMEVANIVGLKVPAKGNVQRPGSYVVSLINAN